MAGVRRHRYNHQFNISIIILIMMIIKSPDPSSHIHQEPDYHWNLMNLSRIVSRKHNYSNKIPLLLTLFNTSLLTFHSVQPLFFPLYFDLLTKVTKARIIDNKQKVLFCKQKSVCLKLHFLLDNFFAIQFFSGIQNIDLGLSQNQTKLCRLHHLPFPIIFPF